MRQYVVGAVANPQPPPQHRHPHPAPIHQRRRIHPRAHHPPLTHRALPVRLRSEHQAARNIDFNIYSVLSCSPSASHTHWCLTGLYGQGVGRGAKLFKPCAAARPNHRLASMLGGPPSPTPHTPAASALDPP
eukprot:971870-Amphidinium_carterae.1